MSQNRLYLGNRRYSSWSLRGWLAVHLAGLDVEDVVIPMAEGVTPRIREATPAGLVPYLEHDGARVWETLAICEYCADIMPALWPEARVARAHARAISAEMHAGFRALRGAFPMNLGRPDFAGRPVAPDCAADLARIEAIWAETRAASAVAGRICSAPRSGMPMPCSRRWWRASSPTHRPCRPTRRTIARQSGRSRWSAHGIGWHWKSRRRGCCRNTSGRQPDRPAPGPEEEGRGRELLPTRSRWSSRNW